MKQLLFAGLILLLSAVPASAAIIEAGAPVISQNAGQTWIITIEGDVDPLENILSTDLYITIGDGVSGDTSRKPLFTLFSMDEVGYLFEGQPDTPFLDDPPTAYVGFKSDYGIAIEYGVTKNLALVTLDASSASRGTWQWSLSDTNVNGQGEDGFLLLNHGTITVVPEPAGLVQLLGLVGTGGFGLWLHRRRKRTDK